MVDGHEEGGGTITRALAVAVMVVIGDVGDAMVDDGMAVSPRNCLSQMSMVSKGGTVSRMLPSRGAAGK